MLERRPQLLVDGVVLTHRVHVAQIGVARDPGRIVVRDPHRNRWSVAKQLDHLGLLLARCGLEEAPIVAACVVGVCAEKG